MKLLVAGMIFAKSWKLEPVASFLYQVMNATEIVRSLVRDFEHGNPVYLGFYACLLSCTLRPVLNYKNQSNLNLDLIKTDFLN